MIDPWSLKIIETTKTKSFSNDFHQPISSFLIEDPIKNDDVGLVAHVDLASAHLGLESIK